MTGHPVPDPPGLPAGPARSSCPAAGTTFVRRLDGPAGAPDGGPAARLDGQRRRSTGSPSFEPLARARQRRGPRPSGPRPGHPHLAPVPARGLRRRRRGAGRPARASTASSRSATRWAARSPSSCGAAIPTGSTGSCCARPAATSAPAAPAVGPWRRWPAWPRCIARATPRRVHRTLGDRLLDARFDQSDLGSVGPPAGAPERHPHGRRGRPGAGGVLVARLDRPRRRARPRWSSPSSTRSCRPHRQRRLADAIPGATVHPVAGDHGVCSTDPAAFVPGLLDACGSVVTRGRAGARRRQAG